MRKYRRTTQYTHLYSIVGLVALVLRLAAAFTSICIVQVSVNTYEDARAQKWKAYRNESKLIICDSLLLIPTL